MKTSTDTRHQKRTVRVQSLFAYSYQTEPDDSIEDILPHLEQIDAKIKNAAPEWPLNQIARVDLAILRQAVWEILYATDVPSKVIIDEAVEIGKVYGGESTPSFINGVLGTINKQERPEK